MGCSRYVHRRLRTPIPRGSLRKMSASAIACLEVLQLLCGNGKSELRANICTLFPLIYPSNIPHTDVRICIYIHTRTTYIHMYTHAWTVYIRMYSAFMYGHIMTL